MNYHHRVTMKTILIQTNVFSSFLFYSYAGNSRENNVVVHEYSRFNHWLCCLLLSVSSQTFQTGWVYGQRTSIHGRNPSLIYRNSLLRMNKFPSVTLYFLFSPDNIEVAHLSTITKEDTLQFYKELLCHDAPKRHKLCVHISSTAPSKSDESDNNDNASGEGLAAAPPSCDVSTFSEVEVKPKLATKD